MRKKASSVRIEGRAVALAACLAVAGCTPSIDSFRTGPPMYQGEAVGDYRVAANCYAKFLISQNPTILIFENTQSASVTTMAGEFFVSDLRIAQKGPRITYELHAIRPIVNLGDAPNDYSRYMVSCGMNDHNAR